MNTCVLRPAGRNIYQPPPPPPPPSPPPPPPRKSPPTRAHNYAAPISNCRGGMGEAHGDPPRHSAEASAGACVPERRVKYLSYPDTPVVARGVYRDLATRISQHSVFLGRCSILRPNYAYFSSPEFHGVVPRRPPPEALFFANMCISGPAAAEYTYLRRNSRITLLARIL